MAQAIYHPSNGIIELDSSNFLAVEAPGNTIFRVSAIILSGYTSIDSEYVLRFDGFVFRAYTTSQQWTVSVNFPILAKSILADKIAVGCRVYVVLDTS